MNAKCIGDQQELGDEVQTLTNHVALLNQQNFELSTELSKFIETDEQVKRTLNRKMKVEEIRHKVDDAIKKSLYDV